jgi:hypothetical protein
MDIQPKIQFFKFNFIEFFKLDYYIELNIQPLDIQLGFWRSIRFDFQS